MLNYVITFFVLAVLAAFLGFGGLAADFAGIAKFLALIFVVLFYRQPGLHNGDGAQGESPAVTLNI